MPCCAVNMGSPFGSALQYVEGNAYSVTPSGIYVASDSFDSQS